MSSRGAVLCIANFASNVGYAWWLMENFWVELSELARERGGRAIVAFPKVVGLSDRIETSTLEVVELDFPGSLRRLRGFIRRNDVRTVYLTDRYYASGLYPLLRSWGVKSIIVHDHVPGERPHPSPWKRTLKRLAHATGIPTADLYLAPSEFVRRRFVEVACLPPGRCVTVLNGIPEWTDSPTDIRSRLGLPPDALMVGSVSRVTWYKGIDFIIACADVLIRENPNLYFVHYGDGPGLERFRKEVGERGLAGRFYFPGRESNVRSILPSLTIAFHASRGEAFSLTILEFMAAGLPCVVPRNCGNPEAIEHMVSGMLYSPMDLDDAVGALRHLLADPSLRRTLGLDARRRIAERFTLEQRNRRFREIVSPHVRV
jgi:glycosyltransferase involved in cell wall biosynthesis